MIRFIAFAAVGAAGFLVDAGVLWGLIHLAGVNAFAARIVSIGAAMLATWLMNRTFTFGPGRHAVAEEGLRYGLVAIGVSLFNYAVYSVILLAVPGVAPLVALVVASGSAMLLSFLGYTRLVFRH